jgi:hypothetical protein
MGKFRIITIDLILTIIYFLEQEQEYDKKLYKDRIKRMHTVSKFDIY